MKIVNNLDRDMFREHVSMPYPHIDVSHIDKECLPILVDGMAEGPIALLYTFKGKQYNVGTMSSSALDLLELLKVAPFVLSLNATTSRSVRTATDILEIGVI